MCPVGFQGDTITLLPGASVLAFRLDDAIDQRQRFIVTPAEGTQIVYRGFQAVLQPRRGDVGSRR